MGAVPPCPATTRRLPPKRHPPRGTIDCARFSAGQALKRAIRADGGHLCARASRGTPTDRRISVEQLPDKPRGRRRPRMRCVRRRVRTSDDALSARALARQRAHAEHLARRPAGRARLPEPPVHHDRRRRRGRVRRADLRAEHRRRVRLRDRRHPLRLGGLHRHERVRARQRARRRGRPRGGLPGAHRRLPRRRDHRPARGRPRPDGGSRLLRPAHRGLQRNSEDGRRCADRARLRGLADLDLRPSRRRHLHEGGRRRRRPRGQGRGRHPRGRSPQPRDDRRQRRATTSATAPGWRPTCSRPTPSPPSR